MSCWAVTVYLEPVRNVAVNCTKCCLFSFFFIYLFLTKTIWEYIRNREKYSYDTFFWYNYGTFYFLFLLKLTCLNT